MKHYNSMFQNSYSTITWMREGRLLLHQMHAVNKEFSTLIWDLLLNLGWLRTVSGTPPQIDAICFSGFPYCQLQLWRYREEILQEIATILIFSWNISLYLDLDWFHNQSWPWNHAKDEERVVTRHHSMWCTLRKFAVILVSQCSTSLWHTRVLIQFNKIC